MHIVRSAAFVGLCGFGLSLVGCVVEGESEPPYDDPSVVEEDTGADQSELMMLDCSHVGGCTTWDATNGCTQLTCCTVCGGDYRCSELPTLGSEQCVFYPRL